LAWAMVFQAFGLTCGLQPEARGLDRPRGLAASSLACRSASRLEDEKEMRMASAELPPSPQFFLPIFV